MSVSFLTQSVEKNCPSKTADIVHVARVCAQSLQKAGVHLPEKTTLVPFVINSLHDILKSTPEGISLVLFEVIRLTGRDIPKDYRAKLRSTVYGSDYSSVATALDADCRRHSHYSDPHVREQNEVEHAVALILTNDESHSGYLSHPRSIMEELENINSALSSGKIVDSKTQIQFLEALQAACLAADRSAATIAAVGIREVVGSPGSVELEHFTADSDDHYRAESLRRRGSQTCVSIHVRQHDALG